jgi:Fe-S-cluster-containing dehydrogenase component
MTRYGFVIDETKCNGCYACFLACKDEYCGNDYPPVSVSQPMTGHFWMKIVEKERGRYPKVKVAYTSIPCQHCENAACVKTAKNGEVYKRADGIVIIDPVKAVNKKELMESCPHKVIYWNEEKKVAQKCTMCAHLLDQGWKEPRCVEACPTGALIFGDLDDPKSEVAKIMAEGKTESLRPELNLKEKVRYIGLPKKFVAGTVIFQDTDECAEDVSAALEGEGEKKTIKTNNYGDFEFEGLPSDKEYTVRIEAPGYKSQKFQVKTTEDVYLGEIFLSKTATRKTAVKK